MRPLPRTDFAKIILILAFMSGCATSPLGRNQLLLAPEQQVESMGIRSFAAMKQQKRMNTRASDNRFVNCVADALIRQTGGHWEVVVFDDPTANAFALPGGKIGVHSGILAITRTQDQLATVLGHELAHVLAHHANERLSQQLAVRQGLSLVGAMAQPDSASARLLMGVLGMGAQYGILLPYSRTQESEADLYGLELMAKAGFDPQASVAFWQNMDKNAGAQQPEFLSTHPSHENRIRELERQIPAIMARHRPAKTAPSGPQCERGR